MPWASFNRFELELSQECVADCSQGGDVSGLVSWWLDNDSDIQYQLLWEIPYNELAAELAEYGAWDEEELKDWRENQERIIWIAAGDIHQEQFAEETNNEA